MGKLIAAGVDTGLSHVGFGCVSFDTETLKISLLHESYLQTKSNQKIEERLLQVGMMASEMATTFNPHVCYVENFFAQTINRKFKKAVYSPAAQPMYMAMGVIMYAMRHNKPLICQPQVAKRAVAFHRADKDQVAAGVKQILGINYDIGNEHVNDAIALAIARVFSTPIYQRSNATLHLPVFL